jgi:hypothetical protein
MNRSFQMTAMSLLMGVVMGLGGSKCLGQTPQETETAANNIAIECDNGAEWDFN